MEIPPRLGAVQDRYRATLDSDTDPTIVSRRDTGVQTEQVTAEATLRRLTRRHNDLGRERHIVANLGNITTVLRDADSARPPNSPYATGPDRRLARFPRA